MVRSILSGVHRRLGDWCSVVTGLTGAFGLLPGLEENSPTSGAGVLAAAQTDRATDQPTSPRNYYGGQVSTWLRCLQCVWISVSASFSTCFGCRTAGPTFDGPVRIVPGHGLHPFSVNQFDTHALSCRCDKGWGKTSGATHPFPQSVARLPG